MLIILITLLTVIIPGIATAVVAYRWPQATLTAPKLSVQKVEQEARQHRRLVTFTRSRLDPGSATGLLLSAAVLVVVVGTALVAILLVMIHTNSGFARLDSSVSLFGAHHATGLSTSFLRFYTQLGGALVIVPLAIIVAIVETLRQRTVTVFAFLALVVGGQFLVANVIKAIVNRARPNFDQLTGFSGSSFPSGHAVAAAACLAAFALVIGRRRSIKVRSILAGLGVGLAFGIACCRVMLGVHWLTDVFGGLALGWAWFALCSIAFGGYQMRFGAPAKVAEETVVT
jgi:membrane-associated phospholipid phosphatase